ncbi:MAG: TonB-dependent receptor, partial [Sinobacteraceae bacterium]|nr:TonB-dependent receptor [Nevskiaceae bacterium]
VGNARIYGVESNVDLRLSDNWSLQAAANYTDSRLVASHYATFQSEIGERLPFAPFVSYSFNIRYEHPLADKLRGYGQFDLAHKGDMWNGLTTDDKFLGLPRVLQPSYSILNLRFGVTPEGGRWLGEFYITNLTDKNAIVYVNTGNFDLRETTNEPRVFGIRVNYRFGKDTNPE